MTKPFPCCQCPSNCHCPDYEDDWTFVFCGVSFVFGTWVSGTKIEDFLNSSAFNVPLDYEDVISGTSSVYYYIKTLTLPGGGTTYTSGIDTYKFKTLTITIGVQDLCGSPRAIGFANIGVTATYDLNGTPEALPTSMLNQINSTTVPNCGSTLSMSLDNTDRIRGGTVKGTTGVVSLTC